jgi:DNA-binding FrmR family transcriptional regulator
MAGYAGRKPELRARLRRISGQIGGIERMVEADTYCLDVLTQISAVTKALKAVASELLEAHLESCVKEAMSDRRRAEEKVSEAWAAIDRLLRS